MKIFVGTKPERQQLAALMRLNDPVHETLLALFRERLAETKDSLVAATDVDRLRRLQGRAEVLQDFLDAVHRSPEVLERLNKP